VNLPVRPQPSSWFLARFRWTTATSVPLCAPSPDRRRRLANGDQYVDIGFKRLDELLAGFPPSRGQSFS